ncbi:MAG TPA: hypothetical protein VFQ75_08970 [Candidatus Limnocylindrales bacterium]|jgi:hypothetical protein|nr:hypothetical protein [Candidatus Limnocylindrales bacterium]
MTHTRPTGDINRYEIRVRGRLDARWSAWFDGLELTPLPDGTTVIVAEAVDQAALHGLLRQVRDAGLSLISVARLDAVGDSSHQGDA